MEARSTRAVQGYRQVALSYFRDEVGSGQLQRIDGIACFSPLPGFWFWRLRLRWMVARGELIRKEVPSMWRSCDGMPAYGLPQEKAKTS